MHVIYQDIEGVLKTLSDRVLGQKNLETTSLVPKAVLYKRASLEGHCSGAKKQNQASRLAAGAREAEREEAKRRMKAAQSGDLLA